MSTLNEEIARLEAAKAAIDEILISKGVVIPENATLDTYYTLIDSIKAGVYSHNVTSTKANVLIGTSTITSDSSDKVIEGTMPNNGTINNTIDGINITSFSIPEGYTKGGTISLTNDIEIALMSI
jgi:hypothetical protein